MSRRDDVHQADLFGFDPIGGEFHSTPEEHRKLLGRTPLAIALYYRALKPFAKGDGRVYAASYYRLGQILAHRRRCGRGVRIEVPTLKVLRDALDDLIAAELVLRSAVHNIERGVLQIWLVEGVGGSSSREWRADRRAGSHRPQTRADAGS